MGRYGMERMFKTILIGVIIGVMGLILLLSILGPVFGIEWRWVFLPGFLGFMVVVPLCAVLYRPKKPNPHINKELIEKLDKLEELEGSQSNRGGGSRKSPNPHSNTELIKKLERLEKLEKSPDRDKRIPD
jgi:hypothetical protein